MKPGLSPDRRSRIAERIKHRLSLSVAAREKERERSRQRAREARAVEKGVLHPTAAPSPPAATVAARRAEIPDDTRGLTARVLGDPLPGRSALDRERGG